MLENSPTSGPRLVQMLTPDTPRVTPAADAGQAVDNLLEESEQLEKPKISKIKSRVKVADKENVPQSARTHKAEARELRPRPCHVEALCPRRPAPNSAKQKLCGHEKDGFVEKQEITDEERSSVEERTRMDMRLRILADMRCEQKSMTEHYTSWEHRFVDVDMRPCEGFHDLQTEGRPRARPVSGRGARCQDLDS